MARAATHRFDVSISPFHIASSFSSLVAAGQAGPSIRHIRCPLPFRVVAWRIPRIYDPHCCRRQRKGLRANFLAQHPLWPACGLRAEDLVHSPLYVEQSLSDIRLALGPYHECDLSVLF